MCKRFPNPEDKTENIKVNRWLRLALGFWKTLSSRRKRILTIIAFFFVSIIIMSVGVLTPLSREEASSISQELDQLRQNISVQFVFGNNFMLCLAIFVPIAGPIFGGYVLYSTGVVIAAESITYNIHPLIGFLSFFILPVIWLELLANSIAFAESVWLTRRMLQHRGKSELGKACILISISAVILLVAAITEIVLILMFPQG